MATNELDLAIARRLGSMILEGRKAKGWTQLELAGAADISPSGLSLIETGARIPLAPTFIKLAHALGWEQRPLAEFLDLAWKPLPYGKIGMRLELVSADKPEDSSLCNVFVFPVLSPLRQAAGQAA